MLLMLAVCSGSGAIYHAYEMERRANSLSGKLEHLILQGDAVPNGFEEALSKVANQIAVQENYSQAILQRITPEWKSMHFGYGIAFVGPSNKRPLTGYEELSMRTGYAHAFTYISKPSVGKLILTFLEGGDLKEVLEELTLWVWGDMDMKDEWFLQSMQGIAYMAYSTATSPQHNYEFQKQPEKFWVDLYIDDKREVTILLRVRDSSNAVRSSPIHLDYMSLSDLEELVGIDALTRGGKVFYRLYKRLLFDWANPGYLPVVLGRL